MSEKEQFITDLHNGIVNDEAQGEYQKTLNLGLEACVENEQGDIVIRKIVDGIVCEKLYMTAEESEREVRENFEVWKSLSVKERKVWAKEMAQRTQERDEQVVNMEFKPVVQ
mgnify:CR=1 FL=1|jgi:hypothetical protein